RGGLRRAACDLRRRRNIFSSGIRWEMPGRGGTPRPEGIGNWEPGTERAHAKTPGETWRKPARDGTGRHLEAEAARFQPTLNASLRAVWAPAVRFGLRASRPHSEATGYEPGRVLSIQHWSGAPHSGSWRLGIGG